MHYAHQFLLSFGLLVGCGGGAGEAAAPDHGASAASGQGGEARERAGSPNTTVLRQPVPIEGAPRIGASSPLVYLVIFSDFECPYCQRMSPVVHQLLADHPEEVQVQFRQSPLPFHSDALPAACASLEAYRQGGDSGFWQMHDRLFENQESLSFDDLVRYADGIVQDLEGFTMALEDGRHEAAVEADTLLGARLGVRGTPVTFVNGRPIVGGRPYSAFAAVVSEELALTRQLVREGTPRGDVYQALMRRAGNQP